MKILTLTTLYPNRQQPNFGIFIRHRTEALSKYAHVRIAAPVPWVPPGYRSRKTDIFKKVQSTEKIGPLQVDHPRYLIVPKIGRRFYGDLYFHSLKKYIKSLFSVFKFDILDVHWGYPDGYAGVLFGKQVGCPVSITLRGSDIHTYPKYPERRKPIASTLQKADGIIALSGSMMPLIKKLDVSEDKIQVISNGVNTDVFTFLPRQEARKILDIDSNDKIFLAVGRLDSPKRFDLLIQALSEIIAGTSHNPRLIIIGAGPFLNQLKFKTREAGITERVQFTGEIPNSELNIWFNAADFFCLASESEGCPNVLLESLSCGTPVIASRVGGVPEIITSHKIGLTVDFNSASAWTQSMTLALERNWDRKIILKTQDGNHWNAVGSKIYQNFKRIIDNNKIKNID